MNMDANSQNTAILNKLILLVLSLILVCLVLLVLRAYTKPSLAGGPAPVAETPVPAEEPIPVIVDSRPPPSPPPARRQLTNVVRAATGAAPAIPPPAPPDAGTDGTPAALDPVTAVVAGVGVLPNAIAGPGIAGDLASADILGFATLLGQPPREIELPLTPACGRINRERPTTRHFVVNPEGRLANVIVYISSGLGRKYTAPASSVLLDQIGCMYQPYVLGLQTGQRLQVRNSDPEMHNVHVTSKNNPEFNFAQLKGQVNEKRFEKPEVFLRIKCDVHPWMFAYLGVFDHPFFAVTDTNGLFHLPNGLRAGRYTLTATHLKAGTLSQQIEFHPGEQKAIEFQFPVPGAIQAQSNETVPAREPRTR